MDYRCRPLRARSATLRSAVSFLRCGENFAPYLVRSGKWPTADLRPTLIRQEVMPTPLSGLLPRRRRDPVPCCARIPRPAMRTAGYLFRLTAPANRTVSAPERWHVRRLAYPQFYYQYYLNRKNCLRKGEWASSVEVFGRREFRSSISDKEAHR